MNRGDFRSSGTGQQGTLWAGTFPASNPCKAIPGVSVARFAVRLNTMPCHEDPLRRQHMTRQRTDALALYHNAVRDYTLLTAEEEVQLARAWREEGD